MLSSIRQPAGGVKASLTLGLFLVQPEQLSCRRDLGAGAGGAEAGDGVVEKALDESLAHRFDAAAVGFRPLRQAGESALDFVAPGGLRPPLKGGNRWLNLLAFIPGGEAGELGSDYCLDGGDLEGASIAIGGCGLFEVVDVEKAHAFEGSSSGFDVAGDGDIDDDEGAEGAGSHRPFEVGAANYRIRGGR